MPGDPAMLTTLARLQGELKNTSAVTSDASKTQLTAIIIEVSHAIAHACNREFFYAEETELVGGHASPFLTVRRTPIDTNQAITITSSGAVLDISQFQITAQMAKLGRIQNRGGWNWTAPVMGNIQGNAYTGYADESHYSVTYSGGYVTPQQALDNAADPVLGIRTLPYDLERACIDWCIARWAMRGKNPILKSESLMSYSYSLGDAGGTAGTGVATADSAIARYRRVGVSR